jgi:hypothetical protein
MRISLFVAGPVALVLAACGGSSVPTPPPSSGPIPAAPPPKPAEGHRSLADSSDEDAKAIAAGGDAEEPAAPPPSESKAVEITPKGGETVRVKVGQDIVVTLPQPQNAPESEWKAAVYDKTIGQPKREKVEQGTRFVWSTKSPLDLAGSHAVEFHLTNPKKKDPEQKINVTFDIAK